jgi:hypothetical protein
VQSPAPSLKTRSSPGNPALAKSNLPEISAYRETSRGKIKISSRALPRNWLLRYTALIRQCKSYKNACLRIWYTPRKFSQKGPSA